MNKYTETLFIKSFSRDIVPTMDSLGYKLVNKKNFVREVSKDIVYNIKLNLANNKDQSCEIEAYFMLFVTPAGKIIQKALDNVRLPKSRRRTTYGEPMFTESFKNLLAKSRRQLDTERYRFTNEQELDLVIVNLIEELKIVYRCSETKISNIQNIVTYFERNDQVAGSLHNGCLMALYAIINDHEKLSQIINKKKIFFSKMDYFIMNEVNDYLDGELELR